MKGWPVKKPGAPKARSSSRGRVVVPAMTLRFHDAVWPESKLVDSYQKFLAMKSKGTDLQPSMSQYNHPNWAGHLVVAAELEKAFASD